MTNIRYPNISGNEAAQLLQVKNYLYQLVDQLNYALGEVESTASTVAVKAASSKTPTEKEAQDNFNSIKALIIKSADIVNSYYEEINHRLEGVYVAEATFPEGSAAYIEKTRQDITANSQSIELAFTNIQQVLSDIESINDTLRVVNAYIKPGLLDYDDDGIPIYGLEIGQKTEIDGEEVYNKYARFTSSKLSFFDSNDNEVAYVSDRRLYITQVEVTGSFSIGKINDTVENSVKYRTFTGFMDIVRDDGSVVTKWVSRKEEV